MSSTSAEPIKTFGMALTEVGKDFDNILAISADSSSGSGLTPFQDAFPDRHIEFGIMEQGVIGYAAGLATTGKIPFVVAIAPFVTSRPFEMVRNDLGYMRQNVKVVGRCAGMSYSDLGPTHHSLEDIAILRTIPGFTIISPSDPVEIKAAVRAIAEFEGPVYLRIAKAPMPILNDSSEYKFEIGKGVTLKEGNDVTIISTGTMVAKSVAAAEILKKKGVNARVINIHTLKPFDEEIVNKAARETGRIVTVEEHYIKGGLGSIVAETVVQNTPVPVRMIGVPDQFASNGPFEELNSLYGLQADSIAEEVLKFIK
jgi:transketolase